MDGATGETGDRPMGASGDRTEKATPKKIDEARRKGQVARSREVNTALSLLALFGVLAAMGGWLLSGFAGVMSGALSSAGTADPITPASGWGVLLETGDSILRLTAPFAIAGLIVGIVATAGQVKPGLVPGALTPRFSALSPKNGIKRILGPRSLVTLLKDLIKVVVTGAVAYGMLKGAIPDMTVLLGAGPGPLLDVVSRLVLRIGFTIGAVYVAIAVLDVLYERWQHAKDLRMTKEDVKREAKEGDVNPEVKGQIKARQRAMAMQRMMSAVPGADVVITNPTHYAVALRYARALPAPEVVAKGADHVAKRIIALARENGVTVVQNPPLARSLHASVEVGQYIPADAFGAVAEILAGIYRAAGRRPAAA
jgi:flagellar biosynthesis protein FlhB